MQYPISTRALPVTSLMLLAASGLHAANASTNAANTATETLDTVVVTAARLDAARNGLSTDTGSSVYRLTSDDLKDLPLGVDTPLNQVMLQVPGVVQDSFGQLHVRGDHANLQYRINGVVIPEAITGFGQSLDTRFANQLNFLTGALPAQYGYRTAGVVDIQTKGYVPASSGGISITGGSHAHREADADASGSNGNFSYSLIGSYLRNDLGIENPTSERTALHDATEQAKGFGYLSYILDNQGRISLMFGAANSRFQIPNTAGLVPEFSLAGVPTIDSATLDARQGEQNSFEALSYQGASNDTLNYQASLFHRLTAVHYVPDMAGDLMFTGIAADITRRNEEVGVQADASYRLNATHTARAGLFYNTERFTVVNSSLVFPADDDGNQASDVPITIMDDSRIKGHTGGVYLQDEWKPFEGLTINYGARYDRVNTVVNEQQFSPRLGMVYELTAATRVHLGYARYFTPPPTEKIDVTSIEKFQNTTNALPSDANTAVSSERSHYFDAGIDHTVSDHFTVGLDAYYRQVKNLQDEGQFGNALIFSAFNYAEGRIYGVEFTTSYHTDHVSAYTNLAYSSAKGREIVTGQFNFDPDELDYIATHWVHLDHEQRWAGSAGLSYKWAATTFSADGIYGSGLRRGFANTESLPSYVQINLAVGHDFMVPGIGKLNGRLSVINGLDRSYQLRDGSGIGVGAPQYGPRQAAYLSLRKDF
jgi:outer membrane receptor protein involved in Fe transport